MRSRRRANEPCCSRQRICSAKSIVIPQSIRDIPAKEFLSRELRMPGNRSVFLTDSGLTHFRSVVEIIDKANLFDGTANFSDIWSAWVKVAGGWFSEGVVPENAQEVLHAIANLVRLAVQEYTYIVPVRGIELDGADSFDLAGMTVLRMSLNVLDSAQIQHDHEKVSQLLDQNKNHLWLRGSARGTPKVAQQRFSDQATLIVGVLAIAAASMYEHGAINFHIGMVMNPEESVGQSTWFSWNEKDRTLSTHYQFARGQGFPINKVLGEKSDLVDMVSRAIEISQASERSELEEAITRSIYWFSDAHRDPVLVMQLVKYWSCVEAFFSFENEEITQAVSSGLASILVFGGFDFVPLEEYEVTKRAIARFYKLRSKAVHRGSHQHTTERDVAQFSQWVAWMIVTMVALAERGYTTLRQVKCQTERLDKQATRSAKP